MILLTRLSGSPFVLNSDLIERIDSTPDTVVTLVDGSKYVVSEGLREVVNAVRQHRAEVIALSEVAQLAGEAAAFDARSSHQPAEHSSPWQALLSEHLPQAEAGRPSLSVVAPPRPEADLRTGETS